MNGLWYMGGILYCFAIADAVCQLHLHHAHFPLSDASPFPKGMSGGENKRLAPAWHRHMAQHQAQGIGLIEIQGRETSAVLIVELGG
jgi:hypothetical protein